MIGDLFEPQAFALGMVALFNPCGFALLPAYLGYFLGTNGDEEGETPLVAMNRAQVVGLSMSVGFLVVFGLAGVVLASAFSAIQPALAWITLGLGVALALLGVAMVAGYKPMVSLPTLNKGTGSRSVGSMFLFGVSYAIASLSCTMPLFLLAVGQALAGEGFVQRFGGFVSYGLGMGLMATVLTVALAFGQKGAVNGFRQILPYINTISAVILIVVGAYLAWYGYWSTDPIGIPAGPVLWVERRQATVSDWISSRAATLGWGFLTINLGLAAAGLVAKRMGLNNQPDEPSGRKPERV